MSEFILHVFIGVSIIAAIGFVVFGVLVFYTIKQMPYHKPKIKCPKNDTGGGHCE